MVSTRSTARNTELNIAPSANQLYHSENKTNKKKSFKQFMNAIYNYCNENENFHQHHEYTILDNFISHPCLQKLINFKGDGNCWIYCLIFSIPKFANILYDKYTSNTYDFDGKNDICFVIYYARKHVHDELLRFKEENTENYNEYLKHFVYDNSFFEDANMTEEAGRIEYNEKIYNELLNDVFQWRDVNESNNYIDPKHQFELCCPDEMMLYSMISIIFEICISHKSIFFNHSIQYPRSTKFYYIGFTTSKQHQYLITELSQYSTLGQMGEHYVTEDNEDGTPTQKSCRTNVRFPELENKMTMSKENPTILSYDEFLAIEGDTHTYKQGLRHNIIFYDPKICVQLTKINNQMKSRKKKRGQDQMNNDNSSDNNNDKNKSNNKSSSDRNLRNKKRNETKNLQYHNIQKQNLSSQELRDFYDRLSRVKSRDSLSKIIFDILSSGEDMNENDQNIFWSLMYDKSHDEGNRDVSSEKGNLLKYLNMVIKAVKKIDNQKYIFFGTNSSNEPVQTQLHDIGSYYQEELQSMFRCHPNNMKHNKMYKSSISSPGCPLPKKYHTNIKIQYYQGNQYLCVGYSIASCFHYLRDYQFSSLIARNSSKIFSHISDKGINASIDFIKQYHLSIEKVRKNCSYQCGIPTLAKISKFQKYNIGEKKSIEDRSIPLYKPRIHPIAIVFRPKMEKSVVNHCVTIVDDLIFDSTQEYALKLSYDTLCTIYDGISGIEWVINFHHKATPRQYIKHW